MKKSLIALAFGTFALGMAEFVMMSILPYVAQSMQCSIPEAGHLISAYAIGVCVGAPSVVLVARKRPLHQILLGLIVIYLTGNLLMASCSDLHLGVLFRFISGLPHGAYFGVGSIVADRLAPRGKSTSAIAIMCSGMTVANLIGIPAGTWLSDMISWRVIFLFNGAWGILTFILLYRLVPRMEPLPNTRSEERRVGKECRSSEHRTERAVPFPEKCGTLAHHGHDHFRKRRYLLLVQLYQPAHEPDCGIRPFRDHHAYGIGRRQHVRGKPVGWQAGRPLYAGQNHIGRTGNHDFRTAHHFLSRHCRTDAVHLHGLPLRSVRTAATAAVAFFQRRGNDGSGFGTGCLQFR